MALVLVRLLREVRRAGRVKPRRGYGWALPEQQQRAAAAAAAAAAAGGGSGERIYPLGVVVQVALGIVTVLSAAALHPAITHQGGAVLLWGLILRARYLANYPVAGSIRKGTA